MNLHKASVDEITRLARIMLALGQTKDAISVWEDAGFPYDPFFILDAGNALSRMGDEDRALAYWRRLPDIDVYFGMRGLAAESSGNFVTALNNYQISWSITDRPLPSKGEFLLNFCELLRRQDNLTQAKVVCERALQSGNIFWSNLVLGLLYLDERDFVTAEMYFSQAMLNDPDYPRTYLWLGLSLANQGKLPQAMQFYRQGLVLTPNDGWLNYLMAKALWDSGQRTDARKYLEKSIQFVPDTWEAAYLEDARRLLGQLQP